MSAGLGTLHILYSQQLYKVSHFKNESKTQGHLPK